MSKGVGGYMPRKDRIQGSIIHLKENCGENYVELRKGTVKHNMDVDHHWPKTTTYPSLNFLSFEA